MWTSCQIDENLLPCKYVLPYPMMRSPAARGWVSLPRVWNQSDRNDLGDTYVGIGRQRWLVGVVLLHGEQKPLRKIVSSSYVAVILMIHKPCVSDRCVCCHRVCNSRLSLGCFCAFSLLEAFSTTCRNHCLPLPAVMLYPSFHYRFRLSSCSGWGG